MLKATASDVLDGMYAEVQMEMARDEEEEEEDVAAVDVELCWLPRASLANLSNLLGMPRLLSHFGRSRRRREGKREAGEPWLCCSGGSPRH